MVKVVLGYGQNWGGVICYAQCGLWAVSIIWELVRNSESQAPPQTFQPRICLLTRSPGDLATHITPRKH